MAGTVIVTDKVEEDEGDGPMHICETPGGEVAAYPDELTGHITSMQLGRIINRFIGRSEKLKNMAQAHEMDRHFDGGEWSDGFDYGEEAEMERIFALFSEKYGIGPQDIWYAHSEHAYSYGYKDGKCIGFATPDGFQRTQTQ
jgi:hypothetical protein